MNSKNRISSILQATTLDVEITGFETFDLSELQFETEVAFELPTKLRLGHLAEKIVAELIKSSTNYKLLYENIQIQEHKNTIGELDFIIENKISKQIIHLELAYKFYLFDPTISNNPINNWIGPNRNDSLREKLDKLKKKQFSLLYHEATHLHLNDVEIDEVSQALCLLVSLYIPYRYKGIFTPSYEKAIIGYYLDLKTFKSVDHTSKMYYLPSKTAWGMNPAENEVWTDVEGIENYIHISMSEKHAPLCWQKHNDLYTSFFIVWW